MSADDAQDCPEGRGHAVSTLGTPNVGDATYQDPPLNESSSGKGVGTRVIRVDGKLCLGLVF